MERFLILLALGLVSLAIGTAGRYRYPIKEGSRPDQFFERFQLAGNVAAIGVELLLPPVTVFVGLPLLAYTAADLQLLAVIIFQVQLPPVQTFRPGTSGQHSVEKDNLRRTRWPYQTAFALGYFFLVAYVFTIFARYF
ncbi:hypothetical protein [Arthrobacter sp. SLBN-112]|uniref:hypothetical protein n=1 Tax=Arthrobacter sp. SLBN-112 TaxID=2768452 RepID=UPI0027B0197E|nr:hypothetical protein [Arthrobacter sp. SLBN-112]MDQ0798749.1 hypothetical protein [Arthrobacter sp. SLBN-112]